MTTAQNLVASMRFDLGDTGKLVFSDAQLMHCLNRGLATLWGFASSIRSPRVESIYDVTLSAGSNEVVLPSGWSEVLVVRRKDDGTRLQAIRPRDLPDLSRTSLRQYAVNGDALRFDHTPDEDIPLSVVYVASSPSFADMDTESPLPPVCDDALCALAVGEAQGSNAAERAQLRKGILAAYEGDLSFALEAAPEEVEVTLPWSV